MSTGRMRLLILAAITALALIAIPSAANAGLRNCGGGVRAGVVSCAKAKRIAREYVKTRTKSLQGFTCKPGSSRGRCVLDNKIVTFPL